MSIIHVNFPQMVWYDLETFAPSSPSSACALKLPTVGWATEIKGVNMSQQMPTACLENASLAQHNLRSEGLGETQFIPFPEKPDYRFDRDCGYILSAVSTDLSRSRQGHLQLAMYNTATGYTWKKIKRGTKRVGRTYTSLRLQHPSFTQRTLSPRDPMVFAMGKLFSSIVEQRSRLLTILKVC